MGMELVLVMKFDTEAEAKQKSAVLGTAAALMIAFGYPGETITEGPELSTRWMYWGVSMCPFPFVYVIPMFGSSGAGSVVGIQIGYCISDIVSKCGVGLLTYNICKTKSALGLLGDAE